MKLISVTEADATAAIAVAVIHGEHVPECTKTICISWAQSSLRSAAAHAISVIYDQFMCVCAGERERDRETMPTAFDAMKPIFFFGFIAMFILPQSCRAKRASRDIIDRVSGVHAPKRFEYASKTHK